MSVINQGFSLTDAEVETVFLDARGFPNFTVPESGNTNAATFFGTLERINRGETPVWFALRDISTGSDISIQNDMAVVDIGPLQAIQVRVDGASGSVAGRVMQSGAI